MDMTMVRGLGVVSLGVVMFACRSDPQPAADTGSSSGSDTSGSSTMATDGQTSAVATTTTTAPPPDDDTTYGPGCGADPCTPCPRGCEPYDVCIASEWTCDCICEATGTGDPDVCDSLDVALELWLESSINPPVDCGRADMTDDATTWQAVHDCVAASAVGSSFHGAWSMPDLAPAPYMFGAAGRFVRRPEQVWYEVSGTFTLTEYACAQIAATPDCVVDVGEMCIDCVRPTEVAVVCTDE